jgi:hypothetical protein
MNGIDQCKAMIFAAGLGTRLKPFTDQHPKALAPVNGKSLLQRNLDYLTSFGISEYVVNVYHFADQIIEELKRLQSDKLTFHVSHEKDGPFETGGGLSYASAYLRDGDHPFVLMNVDILTNLDLTGMFDYHQKINPLATLAVSERKSSRQLLFDEEMKLVGWKNNTTNEVKWVDDEVKDVRPLSFSGIHIIHPAIFNYLPASGSFSIVDSYLKIAKEELIIGYDHTGDLILDVGKPEALTKAETMFP